MKTTLSLLAITLFAFSLAQAQTKLEKDHQSIMAMSGCYEVTFNFAETFQHTDAEDYKASPNKISKGLEWVEVLENVNDKVVLQHILIVGTKEKPGIVKHWRQDWLYENTALYAFAGNLTWNYTSLPYKQVTGQWTQKVYQVDDSPRYEGSGSWIHADGKSYWESVADAPLPRREYTIRNDYNITRRGNRHEITDAGWVHEQDNLKILAEAGVENILAEEKGRNEYVKVEDAQCTPAQDWWATNHKQWDEARAAWDEVFARNTDLRMAKKVNDMALIQHMLGLSEDATKESVLAIIDAYIKAGNAEISTAEAVSSSY